VSIETGDDIAPGAGVAAGTNDGPGSLGTAKGVDRGIGVAPGDGATDGVFVGTGDWLDGVVDRGEVGGGVCASRDPPNHVSATSEMNRRTSTFAVDLFCMNSSETPEYTEAYLNGRLRRS
jgi:hypothetical protein